MMICFAILNCKNIILYIQSYRSFDTRKYEKYGAYGTGTANKSEIRAITYI